MEPRFIAHEQWSGKRGGAAPPNITSVTPNNCATTDTGISLTLAGTDFTNATGATIHDTTHGGSDISLDDFSVNSSIEITCTYNANIADAQVTFITVTGPGGSDTVPFELTAP